MPALESKQSQRLDKLGPCPRAGIFASSPVPSGASSPVPSGASSPVPSKVPPPYQVIRNQKEHCPNHCHEEAIKVQASHSGSSESVEEEAADYSADDPQDNVENNAFAGFIDQFATDEAREQAQDDP